MRWKHAVLIVLCIMLAVPFVAAAPVAKADEVVDYEPLEVVNSGFEQSPAEATGWDIQVANPTADGLQTEAVVSQAHAYQGTNSLRMVDQSKPKGLFVYSSPIPVTPGETYRLTAQIYVTSKSVRGYIKFYDAAGNEVGAPNALANTLNAWSALQFEQQAPANAATAKVLFYMSTTTNGTEAYIDNVEFAHKKISVVNPLVPPYDAPVAIGDAVKLTLSQSAAYGVGPDGRAEQYLTTVGNPAAFHVVDAATGELLFTQNLPYPDTIWALTTASDGNVYLATTAEGELFRYVVKERRLESLGINPSNKTVFDLKASSDGKLYGATYDNTGRYGRVFEYDIAAASFKDLGVISEGEQYARGLGVTDDYVYVGMGTTARLMRYDRKTGDISELNIPGVSGTTGTLSEVVIAGGKLLVTQGNKLHVLDEATGAYLTTIDFQSKVSPPSPFNPELIYYKLKGDLYTFNLQTLESAKVEGIPQLPDDTAVKAHAWITPASGAFAGKTVLAGMAAFGESFLYDPLSNQYEEHQADVPASPTSINSLEANGDDLFIGGYQRGMSIYDTKTGQFVYSNKAFHQPEGIGSLGGIVYFGTYTGGKMYRLDMTKPLVYNEQAWGNPGLAADLEEEQDRPFVVKSGDGKLFIGTIPEYGMLGGALTILTEQGAPDGTVTSVTYETYRNIIPNQSIIGVAYKDGKVYVGSSRVGGLGTNPTEPEAKMAVYDTVSQQVTTAPFTPSFPGASGPINMIGDLAIGPDGLLWGIADSTVYKADHVTVDHYDAVLFAMDPAAPDLHIVKSKIITQSPYNTSKFRPYYLRFGPDGLLYTTIGRSIFAVDPMDLRFTKMTDTTVNLMTLGPDGSIYYAAGSKLYKIPVKIDHAELKLPAAWLAVGDTEQAGTAVVLANGQTAALGGSAITYTSSDNSIVSVADGTIRAVSPGTATVQAVVTLDGRTVAAPAVAVTVPDDKFRGVRFAADGTVTGEVYFAAPQAGHSVQLAVYGDSAELFAEASVSTATYSTYANGAYGYAFNLNIAAAVEQVRLASFVDGEPYSASAWIKRQAPESPPSEPGNEPPATVPASPLLPEQQLVLPGEITPVDGVAAVELQNGKNVLMLPGSLLKRLDGASLAVGKGDVQLHIPADILAMAAAQVPEKDRENARIAIKMSEVGGQDSQVLLTKAAAAAGADIQQAGPMVEFDLGLVTEEGEVMPYRQFGKPVQLSVKVEPGRDSALLGIYHIADDGQLEYVGGALKDGVLTAEIAHFSKYAPLAYDKSFADVPQDFWGLRAIKVLSARHLVNGVSADEFEPNAPLTRAQFLTMLVRTFGWHADAVPGFRDVLAGAWYADAVSAAAANGITNGVAPGQFAPDAPVTREQMAVWLVRAWEKANGPLSLPPAALFADSGAVSGWAADAVSKAAAAQLLAGNGNKQFNPQGTTTRAEGAQAFLNALEQMK